MYKILAMGLAETSFGFPELSRNAAVTGSHPMRTIPQDSNLKTYVLKTAELDAYIRGLLDLYQANNVLYLGECKENSPILQDYLQYLKSYNLSAHQLHFNDGHDKERVVIVKLTDNTDMQSFELLNEKLQKAMDHTEHHHFHILMDTKQWKGLKGSVYSRLASSRQLSNEIEGSGLRELAKSMPQHHHKAVSTRHELVSKKLDVYRLLHKCEISGIPPTRLQFSSHLQAELHRLISNAFLGKPDDHPLELVIEIDEEQYTEDLEAMALQLNTINKLDLYGIELEKLYAKHTKFKLAFKSLSREIDANAFQNLRSAKPKKRLSPITHEHLSSERNLFHVTDANSTDLEPGIRLRRGDDDSAQFEYHQLAADTDLYVSTTLSSKSQERIIGYLSRKDNATAGIYYHRNAGIPLYLERSAGIEYQAANSVISTDDLIVKYQSTGAESRILNYSDTHHPNAMKHDGCYPSKDQKYLVIDLEEGRESQLIADIQVGNGDFYMPRSLFKELQEEHGLIIGYDSVTVFEISEPTIPSQLAWVITDTLRMRVANLIKRGFLEEEAIYFGIERGLPPAHRISDWENREADYEFQHQKICNALLTVRHSDRCIIGDPKIGERLYRQESLAAVTVSGTRVSEEYRPIDYVEEEHSLRVVEPVTTDKEILKEALQLGGMDVLVEWSVKGANTKKEMGKALESKLEDLKTTLDNLSSEGSIIGAEQEKMIAAVYSDIQSLTKGLDSYQKSGRLIKGSSGVGKDWVLNKLLIALETAGKIAYLDKGELSAKNILAYRDLIRSHKNEHVLVLKFQEVNLTKPQLRVFKDLLIEAMMKGTVYLIGTCNDYEGRESTESLLDYCHETQVGGLKAKDIKTWGDTLKSDEKKAGDIASLVKDLQKELACGKKEGVNFRVLEEISSAYRDLASRDDFYKVMRDRYDLKVQVNKSKKKAAGNQAQDEVVFMERDVDEESADHTAIDVDGPDESDNDDDMLADPDQSQESKKNYSKWLTYTMIILGLFTGLSFIVMFLMNRRDTIPGNNDSLTDANASNMSNLTLSNLSNIILNTSQQIGGSSSNGAVAGSNALTPSDLEWDSLETGLVDVKTKSLTVATTWECGSLGDATHLGLNIALARTSMGSWGYLGQLSKAATAIVKPYQSLDTSLVQVREGLDIYEKRDYVLDGLVIPYAGNATLDEVMRNERIQNPRFNELWESLNAEKDIDAGVEHIREWYKDEFLYNLNRLVLGMDKPGLSWISSFLKYKKGICHNFAQMGAVLLSMTGFSKAYEIGTKVIWGCNANLLHEILVYQKKGQSEIMMRELTIAPRDDGQDYTDVQGGVGPSYDPTLDQKKYGVYYHDAEGVLQNPYNYNPFNPDQFDPETYDNQDSDQIAITIVINIAIGIGGCLALALIYYLCKKIECKTVKEKSCNDLFKVCCPKTKKKAGEKIPSDKEFKIRDKQLEIRELDPSKPGRKQWNSWTMQVLVKTDEIYSKESKLSQERWDALNLRFPDFETLLQDQGIYDLRKTRDCLEKKLYKSLAAKKKKTDALIKALSEWPDNLADEKRDAWSAKKVTGLLKKLSPEEKKALIMDARNANANSSLMVAVLEGHQQVMKELFLALSKAMQASGEEKEESARQMRSFLEYQNPNNHRTGGTALHYAIVKNDSETIELLLDTYRAAGGDIEQYLNARKYGETTLHLAVSKDKNDKIVTLLLDQLKKAGGNIKAYLEAPITDDYSGGKYGETALHSRCRSGDAKVVELLITTLKKAGGDIKAFLDVSDKDGKTALYNAAINGNDEVIRYLLNELEDAGDKLQCLREKTNDGFTPLHIASKWDRGPTIRLLLEKLEKARENKLAYLNERTNDGRTVLMYAVNSFDSMKQLLMPLSDKEKMDYLMRSDKNGKTALHWSAEKNGDYNYLVKTLWLASGESRGRIREYLAMRDSDGKTALMYQPDRYNCEKHLQISLSYLLDHEKYDFLKMTDNDDKTALDHAVENYNHRLESALKQAEEDSERNRFKFDFSKVKAIREDCHSPLSQAQMTQYAAIVNSRNTTASHLEDCRRKPRHYYPPCVSAEEIEIMNSCF